MSKMTQMESQEEEAACGGHAYCAKCDCCVNCGCCECDEDEEEEEEECACCGTSLVGEYFYEEDFHEEEKEEEEEDVAYKCCRDCDYTWDTKAAWEAGKGRVAFSYPAEDIEDGDVVCSLCYKGEEEYFPSDDED